MTRRPPRRARRGLAALAGALLAATVLSTLWTAVRIAEARARIAGLAGLVVETAAAEGYGLHHWLHTARGGLTSPPAEGAARPLDAAETARLEAHAAHQPWVTPPRGWAVTPLLSMPPGQAGDALPHGLLVIRPPAAAPAALLDAVATHLAAEAGGTDAMRLAATAAGVDPARDLAVMAWRFGRIDRRAVLRARRAGHAGTPMLAPLDMDGRDIADAGRISASRAVTDAITGPTTVAAALRTDRLEATSARARGGLRVVGPAVASGTMAVPAAAVPDLVSSGTLTGGAAIVSRRAGGGTDGLDLSSGAGPIAWDRVLVFGAARLTALRGPSLTVTAGGGVLGSATAGALTVGSCRGCGPVR